MKSFIDKFITAARNFRSKYLFKMLEKYCHGDVLDVGGWDFYLAVKDNPKINFNSWTNLEIDERKIPKMINDRKYKNIVGDGENMDFPGGIFDVVVNVQVLEHTFDPLKMLK